MSDTFSTTFEPAPPKGAAPKPKPKPKTIEAVAEPTPTVQPGPPKQRRKRKAASEDPHADFRQILLLMKGLPKARRKIALNMMSIMFD